MRSRVDRLSIARVFLKNPPILIFDEATSALDNESERAVQGSLHRLARNRTTLVIAHRLSTVRNAGRILVLTENGIAEEGTHAELVSSGGAYARLVAERLRAAGCLAHRHVHNSRENSFLQWRGN